jgi:tetratricopeptide (TPR) repeat protein
MNSRSIRVALLLLCGAAIVAAQHHTATGEKPVALLAGLGSWHHPIATSNSQAQKFFDQGLTLVYSFNKHEAQRAFRKAAELDPRASMAYWGESMALGPYINMDGDPDVQMKTSCDAVQAGLKIAAAGSAERAWLDAAATRCPTFADPLKYIRAMHDLAARLPDDPDAQTLYAEALMIPVRWKWYGPDGKPAPGVVDAEQVLEGVLRRFPQHPGANHLYIHAVESSPNPERGVPSAQRLMGIVPAAGHMVHMPGHIWLATGDFYQAIVSNERAVEVDRKYVAEEGLLGGYGMYVLHNMQFLVYGHAMQGNAAETRKAAREMSDAIKQHATEMGEMADVMSTWLTLNELRANLWDDILQTPKPQAPPSLAVWHLARGISLALKGRPDEARKDEADFERIRKTVDHNMQWDTNHFGDVMDLASLVLDARLESSPARAVPKWKSAVAIQDALVYDEPPAWYYPVRESLGGALLLSGDAQSAEAVFREGLRRSPNNGRMLFGLVESLKAQKKTDATGWAQNELNAAWKFADIQLRVKDL